MAKSTTKKPAQPAARNYTVAEVLAIEKHLGSCGNVRQAKLAYCLARNASAVARILRDVRKALEPSAALTALVVAEGKLAEEHADRGPDNRAIKVPNLAQPGAFDYQITGRRAEYDRALARLRKEHAGAVVEREDNAERERVLLSEATDFHPYQISMGTIDANEAGDLPVAAAVLGALIDAEIVTE